MTGINILLNKANKMNEGYSVLLVDDLWTICNWKQWMLGAMWIENTVYQCANGVKRQVGSFLPPSMEITIYVFDSCNTEDVRLD